MAFVESVKPMIDKLSSKVKCSFKDKMGKMVSSQTLMTESELVFTYQKGVDARKVENN